jgi:hypothetical protein
MKAKRYPQFLLIGDSIIQYTSFTKDGFSFGAGLSEHVQRRLDVINRFVSHSDIKVIMLTFPVQRPQWIQYQPGDGHS